MSEINTTQLKTEIARLNRILEALLSFNEVLRKENAYLKRKLVIGNSLNANHNIDIGSGTNNNTNVNVDIGSGGLTNANHNIDIGSGGFTNANHNIDIGSGTLTGGTRSIEGGSENLSAGASNSGKGAKMPSAALPEKIDVNETNAAKMTNSIRQAGFFRVSRKGIKHSALLLLHFYNKGAGNHAALIQISGMSAGGLAKRMGSLRKRGLIIRKSNKVVELTPSALQIIQAAFAGK